MRVTPLIFSLALQFTAAHDIDHCTAIIVGAKASLNGAPMTTHTADCSSCDFRLAKVPAATYSKGAKHDVVLAKMSYPRYVGIERGNTFKKENIDSQFYNWTDSVGIGNIPEVEFTYAYIDGIYGIMNEHQVSIGESTCGARLYSKPLTQGGRALFDVSELSRLALQRTKTARDAIQLMGDLAVQYGYYGAEWEGPGVYGEAGEALTVTDPKEAWIFHILPDDTGASAVWVAQRVPDYHISVVANQFVIHQVDLNDKDNFMGSRNMQEVAIRAKLWDPKSDKDFDFTKVYAMPRIHPNRYYSTRRVWRIFTLANPELKLSPYTDDIALDYPFSIEPKSPISALDLMTYQRDHYEDTEFDMTKGPSSGPYGNPDRYDTSSNGNMSAEEAGLGHFERAISIFRASYSFVSVVNLANADLNLVWFGPYAPHATTYVPIYAKVNDIPTSYQTGSLRKFDTDISFWIHALLGNWVSHVYNHAINFVKQVQNNLELLAYNNQTDIAEKCTKVSTSTTTNVDVDTSLRNCLTEVSDYYATTTKTKMLSLFGDIVTRFHDGYEMSNLYSEHFNAKSLFYPKWWLKQVGYFDKSNLEGKENHSLTTNSIVSGNNSAYYFGTLVLGMFICMLGGFVLGMKYYAMKYHGYSNVA